MPPLAVCAIPNVSFMSDFFDVPAVSTHNLQYATKMRGRHLLRCIMLSSKCQQQLLDSHLPTQHIDGKATASDLSPCGLCLPCLNGTDDIDVTAAGAIILFTVKECNEVLPPKVIMQIVTKAVVKLGDLENDYFSCNLCVPYKNFTTYGKLEHCEKNQVFRLSLTYF